jgi:hypothetical protein
MEIKFQKGWKLDVVSFQKSGNSSKNLEASRVRLDKQKIAGGHFGYEPAGATDQLIPTK